MNGHCKFLSRIIEAAKKLTPMNAHKGTIIQALGTPAAAWNGAATTSTVVIKVL